MVKFKKAQLCFNIQLKYLLLLFNRNSAFSGHTFGLFFWWKKLQAPIFFFQKSVFKWLYSISEHYWEIKYLLPFIIDIIIHTTWNSWNWPFTNRRTSEDFPTADSPKNQNKRDKLSWKWSDYSPSKTSLNWQILACCPPGLCAAAISD